MRPRLTVVVGDPTGIGPEILVRALARPGALETLEPVVVGDARVIARGAALANAPLPRGVRVVDLAHCPPEEVPLGRTSARAGRAAGQDLTRRPREGGRGAVGIGGPQGDSAHRPDPAVGWLDATADRRRGVQPARRRGGPFGDEEIRVIAPAVQEAVREGIDARGPIPADTVFVRARGGEFDSVVTMALARAALE